MFHVVNARHISPYSVEPCCNREMHAHCSHQHELIDPLRMQNSGSKSDCGSHRIADQVGTFYANCIHETKQVFCPALRTCMTEWSAVRTSTGSYSGASTARVPSATDE